MGSPLRHHVSVPGKEALGRDSRAQRLNRIGGRCARALLVVESKANRRQRARQIDGEEAPHRLHVRGQAIQIAHALASIEASGRFNRRGKD